MFCKAAGAWPESLTPRLPITEWEQTNARALLDSAGIHEKKGWIAVQPFSTDPARDWPPDKWRQLADALARLTTQSWTIMEVCGGQTHAIIRFGIDQLLPEGIALVHGPGLQLLEMVGAGRGKQRGGQTNDRRQQW